MKPGEGTGSSGSCWLVTSTLHPRAELLGRYSPIPCSAWRPARAFRRRWRASNLLNQHPSLLPVNLLGRKRHFMALGSHLSFVGGFCWRKQQEAGLVSAVKQWNTTALGYTGSCAPSSHQSSAQLYKTGCKLCSFWLTGTIKVMCALQHYRFDGERSPETSGCTGS